VKELIANFSLHLREAIANVSESNLKKPEALINNVLITGLGGSGIGGTIAAELSAPIASVPIAVNKDYNLPAYVNENTLVIVCSYSGNTEETLSALDIAMSKKAEIACITSGGKLNEIAKAKGFNCLNMGDGNPPRSMLAYSFTYLFYLLRFYDVALFDVKKDIRNAADLLDNEEESIKQAAHQVAKQLEGKTTAIYAVSGNLGIASRLRQQLNENAKMLAWEAEVPEMNHNELVGWEGGNNRFAALFLRNDSDYIRNQKRIDIIKKIIDKKTDTLIEVWSKGSSPIEKALYLIHLGDWVSYYLSEINQVDIIDIKSIDLLKSELSKIPV